ncbi:MAG: IPT/TIG domain-containing protein [Acidobacteriaceae bacterium]
MCGGRGWRRGLLALAAMMVTATAWAGGPRFITGTSGYAVAGVPMAWYTNQVSYFTDPGDLSSTVTHAQADAMVAAAAGLWNIPTASVTLAQGGELAEHVAGDGGGENAYFDGSEVVWPADVEATNYASVQIPVIYDSDGSVIDLLLGSGASDPSGCQRNGVVESVDQFGSAGTIEHAVIVLNGLCVGSTDPTVAQEQLTQMQYQLTRVFGRVLGLAWSQLNDGVFTGATETPAAMTVWPLMHPLDVDCGPYTYQCVQNAFALRPDDINALETLYPVLSAGGGKTLTSVNTVSVSGTVGFPSGQGMELVNVFAVRWILGQESTWEAYPAYSSTTGYGFQQNGGNPVSGPEPVSENAGVNTTAAEGEWSMPYIAAGAAGAKVYFGTQSINPLYWGDYAVGPYQRPAISLWGVTGYPTLTDLMPGAPATVAMTASGAASDSCSSKDGTETSPTASSATGLWNAVLCAADYTAWRKTAVNANTSWTMEVTALNESGNGSVEKLQPVMGVWNLTDATGTLPTVASAVAPLNALVLGMTQLRVAAAASASNYRIAIADEYGAGRPDFAYSARILYASGVSPATVGTLGGTITVSGTGFETGNEVLVNGVMATATSWTSTQIVATVPSMATAGAVSGTAVDVEVLDPTTGGTTDIAGALTYGLGTKDLVALVSAPTSLETGYVAATPFAVRVYAPDGVTPAPGASVSFVVTGTGGGAAVATGCGVGPGCVVTTDATGLAETPLMGVAEGTVTVSGTEMSGGASARATIADTNPVRVVTIGAAAQYLAAGAAGSWSLSLTATQDGAAAVGVPVSWTSSGAGFTLTPSTGVTAANGTEGVVTSVGAIGSGSTNVVTGCAWTSVCANWTAYGVAPPLWVITVASGGGQSLVVGASPAAVKLLVTDSAGHALPGAKVNFYQTAYAWEGVCALRGACASAPVLRTAQSSALSDGSGMVQVMPVEVPGVAQVVRIAAAAETRGFAVATVVVAP